MRNSKKLIAIIAALVITLCAAGGVTLAYILTETPDVENSFVPVNVSCEVIETFTGTEKSNVSVKNTGDITAYVRATFVVMWMADDGSVYGVAPKAGTDYSIQFSQSRWQIGNDGFYYYTQPVDAGMTTEALINSLVIISEPPEGYSLNVHVAATAIQAEPSRAVENAWGATVQADSSILAP